MRLFYLQYAARGRFCEGGNLIKISLIFGSRFEHIWTFVITKANTNQQFKNCMHELMLLHIICISQNQYNIFVTKCGYDNKNVCVNFVHVMWLSNIRRFIICGSYIK